MKLKQNESESGVKGRRYRCVHINVADEISCGLMLARKRQRRNVRGSEPRWKRIRQRDAQVHFLRRKNHAMPDCRLPEG